MRRVVTTQQLREMALAQGMEVVDEPERAGERGEDADGYILQPLDWVKALDEGLPEIEYLHEPYFPRGVRIWIWGATGAAKSIYAMWVGSGLSVAGLDVAYFSEENPRDEDLRRLSLLRPDPKHFRFYWRTGMDLADPAWVEVLMRETSGCAAAFFDSWTDLWSGDENVNREVQQFDATVLKPLQAQGVTPVVLHHTGHPQLFSNRKGATAGRGASSLGQKADVTLELKDEGDYAFTIVYGKPRIGGERQPDRTFRIVDIEEDDGVDGVDIIEIAAAAARAVQELVEKGVAAIATAPNGRLTTSELRAAIGGGKPRQTEVLDRLADDPRVRASVEKVQTSDGKKRDAKVWRATRAELF
jgi:hypothetical protein